jgi:hypothetical protein
MGIVSGSSRQPMSAAAQGVTHALGATSLTATQCSGWSNNSYFV